MHRLICFGVSHRNAETAVRECLALGVDALHAALASASVPGAATSLQEMAILATCNRMEWYTVEPADAPTDRERVAREVAALHGMPAELLLEHGRMLRGIDAARHLCRVSSGLESQLVGESEVLGQVAEAHADGMRAGTIGARLTAVFAAALRAGRRVRHETALGRRDPSVATEAVRVFGNTLGGLEGRTVTVIGTGVMGRLALQALSAAGVTTLRVMGRHVGHTSRLAKEFGAHPVTAGGFSAAVRDSHGLLCAASAPHPIVSREMVREARTGTVAPLLVVDIGFPRNVASDVHNEPGVTVLHLDDLAAQSHVPDASTTADAERIVEEELARWEQGLQQSRAIPLVKRMHQQAEVIRRRQLERLVRELGDLPAGAVEPLERFSRALVRQLLHEPTQRLRRAGAQPREDRLLAAAHELFGLADDAT